ncbi:MMPL family transporter [Streptomyces marincola]|uniref:Transporter n=1 Tax=Streptomyces marincola TaxID=2878388 RepID=A0A1W7CUL0_9ACTN|nr:MMPL family transporter [Streptomyces marincola]ARQ68493.1 transporter [Streptomyces marincola]
MATLLHRIGRGAFRRCRLVLGLWLVALVAVVAGATAAGGSFDDEFTIPGSESQEALDALAADFPAAAGTSAQIVVQAPEGRSVTDPPYAAAIEETVAAAAEGPQVAAVLDPATAGTVSEDGRVALAQVQFEVELPDLRDSSLDAVEDAAETARDAGLRAEVGGVAYSMTATHVSAAELIGVAVALLVLVVTFGSLLAAGMPLVSALIGVGVGLMGIVLLSAMTTVSSTAPTLALMLGLAVGIDYALFILSRHRSQLANGMSPEESAGFATGTAGSAVVFAGLTVIIALSGLAVVGIPFLTVMGLCAAATVLVAVLVAVTLLPALLGLAGHRLVPAPGSRAARREVGASAGTTPTGGERWARLAVRRPLPVVLGVIVLLGLTAIPARDLSLSLPDNGTAAEDSGQRQAYDLISDAFGPGVNGPLLVLVNGAGQDPQALEQAAGTVAGTLNELPGVALAAPAEGDPGSGTAIVQVVPETGPRDPATADLVHEIRDSAPRVAEAAGVENLSVTGNTAVGVDVSQRLGDSLVPFAAVVVGMALVLLILVFRSLLVPLKAALGFLLTVGASFGAVVAIFQWGWLTDVFGVTQTGPVVSFLPIILIAILFGLAMDYEVFMVSRMREEYVRGAAPRAAITMGARHASRVVTAAALIMTSVFASFVFSDDTTIKPMAVALALGVMVDAFLIRMTLVPAVLALLGRHAWWLPAWLDRALPNLDIEGERLRHRTGAAPAPAGSRADGGV